MCYFGMVRRMAYRSLRCLVVLLLYRAQVISIPASVLAFRERTSEPQRGMQNHVY